MSRDQTQNQVLVSDWSCHLYGFIIWWESTLSRPCSRVLVFPRRMCCNIGSRSGVMLLLYWSVPLRTWQDSKQLWSPSPGTSLQSLYSDLMRAGMGWPWGCWPLRDGLTRLVSAHLNTPDIRIYWDYFCLIRSALARMIKEAEWSNQPGARDVCWSGEGGGGLDFTKNTLGTLF